MEKIIVDKDICIGCGFCAANCEEVFKLDSETASTENNIIDNMSTETKENVLDIKEGCPVSAIKIVEE